MAKVSCICVCNKVLEENGNKIAYFTPIHSEAGKNADFTSRVMAGSIQLSLEPGSKSEKEIKPSKKYAVTFQEVTDF